MSGPDLAARMRAAEPGLRRRARRRDTLLEVVRSVGATVEPAGIASVALQHVSSWISAPCWALVASDLAGHVSVLAEQGISTELAPALPVVASWLLHAGQPFLTGNLRRDPRIACGVEASVVGFPLACRGHSVGAILGFDVASAKRAPRISDETDASLRVLLEPMAVALDTALLLKRAEALSVTDDLARLYNSRYLNQVLRRETKRAIRSGRPLLPVIHRSGQLQIDQRYLRAFVWQPRAGRGGCRDSGEWAGDRRGRSLWRR